MNTSNIKKEMDSKLSALRLKRKDIISQFKKRVEQKKINQIRNLISNK